MGSRLLRNFLLGLVSAVVLAVAISLFTAATATTEFYYEITELGTLGNYPITHPFRINDIGQVVGWSTTGTYPPSERAFLWENGTITDLGTLGGNISKALDINNAGQVVGGSLTSNGLSHAFLWQNGGISDLGVYSSDVLSMATGINDNGQVVGGSSQALPYSFHPRLEINQDTAHAVLWQNGGITDLGTLSNDNASVALSINNSGQVFGETYNSEDTPRTTDIFSWQNGVMAHLGTFSSDIIPMEVNNEGQVIGYSYSVNPWQTAAFLWHNDMMTDLGNLGGTYTEAVDINEAGTVVGYSTTSNNTYHAFVWRNGQMSDLNNLLPPNSGWELTIAAGINNNGQIVGEGKFNGQHRAVLLTPVWVTN